MGATWGKAVLLLAVCGGLVACDGPDSEAVSVRPPSALPATGDPGKYDLVMMAQPADRVVEF